VNPFNKKISTIGLFCLALGAMCVAGYAQAQTSGTRVTPCNAATPNDALCVQGDAPTANTDGTAITGVLSYRLEQRVGTAGAWVTGASQATLQWYVTGLAPGTYYFRAYAKVNSIESAASNTVNAPTTAPPPPVPNAPVLRVTKVTISSDRAPVYEVLLDEQTFAAVRGGKVGTVKVGNVCDGDRSTGAGFYALARPSYATLTRPSRSTALVARCG
jgi:predicted phage tail protein